MSFQYCGGIDLMEIEGVSHATVLTIALISFLPQNISPLGCGLRQITKYPGEKYSATAHQKEAIE